MSAGFGDIAPAVEVVDIRGTEIVMQGVPTSDIFSIWGKFREAGLALQRAAREGKADWFEFVAMFPDAVAVLLATGLGHKGNKTVEQEARNLTPGAQAALLEALIRATFADGYGPFVKMAKAMGHDGALMLKIIQALIEPSSPSPSSTEVEQSLKPAA